MCATENDIILEKSSKVDPEQYDAFYQGRQVGFMRLRNGYFYVSCPDINGETIYETYPNGNQSFEYGERDRILEDAKFSIVIWLNNIEKAA
jgi:hypothetical protein